MGKLWTFLQPRLRGILAFIGLVLVGVGGWMAYHPAGLIAPGLIILYDVMRRTKAE